MKQLETTDNPYLKVPLFLVFDLDRTLLNTNAFVEHIRQLLPDVGMTPNDIEQLSKNELLRRGQEFDLIGEIFRKVGESFSADELADHIVERVDGAALLYDGVRDIFIDLKQYDVPAAIMTFGGQLSQRIKLRLLAKALTNEELMPPALIVRHQEKARWLASNTVLSQEGRILPYELSGNKHLIAEEIIVLDDKQSNLETDAEAIRGILINNNGIGSGTNGMRIGDIRIASLLHAR